MGELVVITGPPGAGKSTVSRLLASRYDPSVLVEGDAFFGFLASGAIDPWLPESSAQNDVVIEAAAAATGVFARGRYTVIYDGIVGPWYLPHFAAATGVGELDYVVVVAAVEQTLHRVATRVGHGFTDEAATRKMHDEFARGTRELDERHLLEIGDDGAAQVAERIASGLTAGEFRYRVKE